jgi:hypothetical protein
MDKLDKDIDRLLKVIGVFTLLEFKLLCEMAECDMDHFVNTVDLMEQRGLLRTTYSYNRKVWWHSLANQDSPLIDEFYLEFVKMCKLGPVSISGMASTEIGQKLGLSKVKNYMTELMAKNKIKKMRRHRGYQTYDVVIDPLVKL